MSTATTTTKTGKCPTCGQRTVRAELDDQVIEITADNLTAAHELLARIDRRRTFRVTWKPPKITIAERTDRMVKLKPAGYDGSRIWAEHRCTPPSPAPAGLSHSTS